MRDKYRIINVFVDLFQDKTHPIKKTQTILKLMDYFQVSQLSQSNANIRNFLKSNKKNLRKMFFKFHTMLVKFKAKGLGI